MFLGVYRNILEPPEVWLGLHEFQELAANLLTPQDVAGSRRMLSEMQEADERARGRLAAASEPIRSISTALADSNELQPNGSSEWLQQLRIEVIDTLTRAGFIEKTFQRRLERRFEKAVTVTEFPVDFSPLDSIEMATMRTTNPILLRDLSQRDRFAGKLVLIGNASGDVREAFVVPGKNRPYPAIFLHTCAAYTLINPLYEMTTTRRLAIDSLFFLTVILGVTAIRFYHRNQAGDKGASHQFQELFTLSIVIVAMIVGVSFVHGTRVIWDDFLFAPVVLIYPALERRVESSWRQLPEARLNSLSPTYIQTH